MTKITLIDNIKDLTITSPQQGDILVYSGTGFINVPHATSSGTGSGHTIQDEGISLPQRTKLNFVGSGVTVTDDGADTTIVTIPGASGLGSVIAENVSIADVSGYYSGDNVELALQEAGKELEVLRNRRTFSGLQNYGVNQPYESKINFVGAGAISITMFDEPGSSRSTVSIATYPPTAGHRINYSGLDYLQRPTLVFSGAGVAVSDNNDLDATVVTIAGGSSNVTISGGSSWIPITASCTYNNGESFEVHTTGYSFLYPGRKIRLKQGGGWKYFYVNGWLGGLTETIKVYGGPDYPLTNAAITDVYYSTDLCPEGFPSYFNEGILWGASSSNPAIGNGTLEAKFRMEDKVCKYFIKLLAGSTTTFGTGFWSFTLPAIVETGNFSYFGIARARRPGVATYMFTTSLSNAATSLEYFMPNYETANNYHLTSTYPMTWQSGDYLEVQIEYAWEAA